MTNTQRIDAQATQWAVRLGNGSLAAADRHELEDWLAADARHGGALLRAQAAWEDVDRLAALAVGADLRGAGPRGPRRFRFGKSSAYQTLAAALLLCLGLYVYKEVAGDRYSTPVGGIETVQLADGSQVTLNTDTRLRVRFGGGQRRIELERGEALFRVAKDPARPFTVHTGTLAVRAVGTTFAVRNSERGADVTVTEGLVELVDNSRKDSPVLRRLGANEHATVVNVSQVAVRALPPEQTERELAWRDGLVKFTGEPLREAVERINRHNRRHIVIDDSALAARPVVGSFRATDPANFAATVAVALDAQSVDSGDVIHLRPR